MMACHLYNRIVFYVYAILHHFARLSPPATSHYVGGGAFKSNLTQDTTKISCAITNIYSAFKQNENDDANQE